MLRSNSKRGGGVGKLSIVGGVLYVYLNKNQLN